MQEHLFINEVCHHCGTLFSEREEFPKCNPESAETGKNTALEFICPVCGKAEEFVTFAGLHLMLDHNWHLNNLEALKSQLQAWGAPLPENIYGYLKNINLAFLREKAQK